MQNQMYFFVIQMNMTVASTKHLEDNSKSIPQKKKALKSPFSFLVLELFLFISLKRKKQNTTW